MIEYTYEDAMNAVAGGMTIAEAFAPFLVAADAASPLSATASTLNYRNIGYKNDAEGRILARDERTLLRLDGLA